MINLIKNELIKIFKKRSTLILIFLLLAYLIFNNVMTFFVYDEQGNMKNSNTNTYYRETYEAELKEAKLKVAKLENNKETYKEDYIRSLADQNSIELVLEYVENFNDWKNEYIHTTMYSTIIELAYAKANHIQGEELERLQTEYNNHIDILKNNDWKEYTKQTIKLAQEEKELLEKQAKDLAGSDLKSIHAEINNKDITIKLETYRLNNNYGYDHNNWGARTIRNLQYNLSELYSIDLTEDKSQINMAEYQSLLSSSNIELKSLEDNINYKQTNTASNMLVNAAQDNVFIIIIAIVIAGGIVASEFNKGTIKLLLVRPYKRSKILFAKYIAVMIVILFTMILTLFAQSLIGVILFNNTFIVQTAVYSFTANSVIMVNTVLYALINMGIILVQTILLSTLAFAISTMFKSAVLAVALPIVGYSFYQVINILAMQFNLIFMKYFVSLNWDFNQFLFGRQGDFAGITFPFAVTICIAYLFIMLIPTFIMFKKRDVVNQ